MKFKLLSYFLTISSIAIGQGHAAVEHFDVSNAHSQSQQQSSLYTGGGGKPIAQLMARSGPAPVYNAVADKRGSYGNTGYVDQNVQNAAMQGVAVTQIATSGSLGSASSISSYGVPATGGGYGQQSAGDGGAGQGSQTYYYYHYPPPGSQYGGGGGGGSGWGDMTTGGGDDDDLKGLTGLLGLLGLKGLKGVGLLALLKLLKPLLLLSLLFLPLLLLPLLLLLLFIPIPVITPMQPVNGRSLMSSAIVEGVTEKVSMGLQVLNSSQCVERIACEISQKSKGTFMDNFISSVLDKTEAYLPKIWLRGMRTYVDSGSLPESDGNCAKFSCKEVALFSATSSTTATAAEEDKKKVENNGLNQGTITKL